MKIKYLKHGYYNSNYPPGSIVEVDEAYAKFVMGNGDAEAAFPSDKITDPTPYTMKVRTTPSEDALVAIASVLTKKEQPSATGKT